MSRAALDAIVDVVLAYHPQRKIKPRKRKRRSTSKKQSTVKPSN
jgi:hypothetical protein